MTLSHASTAGYVIGFWDKFGDFVPYGDGWFPTIQDAQEYGAVDKDAVVYALVPLEAFDA